MAKVSHGRSWLLFVAAVAVLSLSSQPSARAEDRSKDAALARNLVSEAMHRRIYGLQAEHTTLLTSALSASPDFAPAHWARGRVAYMDRWLTPSDLIDDQAIQKRLTNYETARDKVQPTVAGYLALADWCAEHSLPLQERAHLFQVLDLAPNHAAARQRLGFVLVNGEWIKTQTIWEGMYDVAKMQAAFAKWQQPIQVIRKGLRHRKPDARQMAQDKLAAITDPQAIFALEQLASDCQSTGELVVDCLSEMQQHEAAAALVRQAVFSQYPRVRESAGKKLAVRRYDEYVPRLLAEMATPIESRFATISTRGRLLYRHVFFRESQEQRQVLVFDTRYRRVVPVLGRTTGSNDDDSNDGGDAGPSFEQVVTEDLQDTIQSREQQRQLQNAWLNAMNNRICHVLRQSTGQQLGSKPQAWWDWWDQQSQVTRLGSKQLYTKSQQETKTFVDPVVGTVPQIRPQTQPRRCECFAAGTPVLTASGLLEIERLKVGDLVLAKHPETGELAYRPVLATTIRPPEQVVKIRTTTELIEATSGHPLWVDGDGWSMASDLKSGMVLHGLEQGVVITDLKPGNVKRTYNLIIDGFHSYFVGFDHVLVHDNTPCRPTNSVVPGLAMLAN